MYVWNEVLCVYVCACALTTKISNDVTSHMRFPHEADIATISSFTYRWKYLITAYLICMYVCMHICVINYVQMIVYMDVYVCFSVWYAFMNKCLYVWHSVHEIMVSTSTLLLRAAPKLGLMY